MSDFAITPLFKQIDGHGSTTYLLYDHQDGTATLRVARKGLVWEERLLNIENMGTEEITAGFIMLCQVL